MVLNRPDVNRILTIIGTAIKKDSYPEFMDPPSCQSPKISPGTGPLGEVICLDVSDREIPGGNSCRLNNQL